MSPSPPMITGAPWRNAPRESCVTIGDPSGTKAHHTVKANCGSFVSDISESPLAKTMPKGVDVTERKSTNPFLTSTFPV